MPLKSERLRIAELGRAHALPTKLNRHDLVRLSAQSCNATWIVSECRSKIFRGAHLVEANPPHFMEYAVSLKNNVKQVFMPMIRQDRNCALISALHLASIQLRLVGLLYPFRR